MPSRAGAVQLPSRAGSARRAAPRPSRACRIVPRSSSSAVSRPRQSAIRTTREQAAGAVAERHLELLEDRRREGREPQHRQHAELGEQVERRRAACRRARPAAAAAGRRGRRTATGPRPERPGGVLEALVEPAQHRRHRQEDEREVGQRRHEHGAAQALQVGAHRHPRVGVDERRHGERADHQHPPEPGAGQRGPLDQPGGRDAERRREGDGERHERRGVAQQLTDPGPPQQVPGRPPADVERLDRHDHSGSTQTAATTRLAVTTAAGVGFERPRRLRHEGRAT